MIQNSYKAMYRPNFYESTCLRCNETVYQVDRVGPLKDFTFFHSGCFKCAICGTKLTLKTYYNNQHRQEDKEVYCNSHVPKIGPGHLDGSSVGIRSALNVPKSTNLYNEQIRGPSRVSNDSEEYNQSKNYSLGIFIEDKMIQNSCKAMYRPNFYESTCLRCNETVYQVDRVGPLKDFTFFHSGCFKCAICGTKLTLKTYYNNQHRQEDKEVYCNSHVPKIGPGHLDGSSVGIRSALNVPKSTNLYNEQIRGPSRVSNDSEGLHVRTHINGSNHQPHSPTYGGYSPNNNYSYHQETSPSYQYGRFDASALHIAHALKQTELQKSYKVHREKPIDCYLDRDEQKKLEMRHRKEEDDLFRKFQRQREEEEKRIREEIRDEWEKELERLTSKFEREMQIKRKREEQNTLSLRHQQEKDDLEKNMTLRRDKKKESLTRKMLEHERAATAALVEKQSHEMLELINEKRSEYMQAESLYIDHNEAYTEEVQPYPSHAPAPAPPALSKFQFRYEYDDHYFLTDPKEFIYEFFPLQSDWQLLKSPITQQEFEELPFVRSLFFRYGLYFSDPNTKAVMYTDSTGAATVKIAMPSHMQATLIFHYNLKFYDSEGDTFEGVSLKRFVMQDSLVYAGRELEIQFRMSRQLTDFMATLHKNGVEEKRLSKFVSHSVAEDIVTFNISFPEEGQYGLDIYTREMASNLDLTGEKHLLTHCCKYLINSSKRN
uniref:Hillarin-like n=1 Tax=Diabrotica virgifera virgifera TaxID=50390 RepID=A0A6P7FAX4_DIAVI